MPQAEQKIECKGCDFYDACLEDNFARVDENVACCAYTEDGKWICLEYDEDGEEER